MLHQEDADEKIKLMVLSETSKDSYLEGGNGEVANIDKEGTCLRWIIE